jgi:hypothetical protein
MRTYHGASRKWDWNDDDLPKNKFQRRFFSSTKKAEARKYGKVIHHQDIDTTDYHHTDYIPFKHEKIIMSSIRKGKKGVVFYNMPDQSGDDTNPHTEVVTFDHNTVKKVGYSK